MKYFYFVLFFLLTFTVNRSDALDIETFNKIEAKQTALVKQYLGDPNDIEQVAKFVKEAIKGKKLKTQFLYEEESDGGDCLHCPRHLQLTDSVNRVLEKMKQDPSLSGEEELPLSINRLKFLFYTVKTRSEDGSYRCQRLYDRNPGAKAPKLDGQMEMVAEDVFSFDGVSKLQILDPKKEEVVYYYRGEGDQKNIIVQAVLTKDGGKFRYYNYQPTEEEKNPYGLPSLGPDETLDQAGKEARKKAATVEDLSGDLPPEKDKFSIELNPKLETRHKIIPKNIQIAKGEISQPLIGTDLRVNGTTNLSLKGNDAKINIQDEAGKDYVKIDLYTTLKGETKRTVVVPYDIRLGADDDPDALKINGRLEEGNDHQVLTMALTDRYTQHFRTEIKKDKKIDASSYSVVRDFNLSRDEMATVGVGKNEQNDKYVTFQHRKVIKENITMVLDVRVDDNHQASFSYQLKARF